ncbi:MAG: hypothetical protein DID89_2727546010 [Candidatus Nitrotoga sp. CP45]|nr:hypothetical protein [Methylophilus sp.]RFC41292.1 MAG: hypothetical protein DID89_2727546010 [Candidatus Nitrotoga sp. CP45]
MSMFDADPTKTSQQILNDVREATHQSHMPGLPLLPFATLLVRLSHEASATADKNLLIQKRMIVITLIVLAISVAQLALAFLQFQTSAPNNSQSIVLTPKPVQADANQKDVITNKKPIEPDHVPAAK